MRTHKNSLKMSKLFLTALLVVFAGLTFAGNEADTYKVNVTSSTVKWTGYHLAKSYEHYGYITIQSATIEMEGNDLVGGEFVIDMNSLSNTDIADEKDNAKLVKDLKSKRFFNAKEFPTASLKIRAVEKKSDNAYGVTADITIRGITKEIQFDATRTKTGNEVEFTAAIEVDRIAHDVMAMWSIENAILSNKFDLEIKVVASR